MSLRLDTIVSCLIGLAAVTVAVSVAHRAFGEDSAPMLAGAVPAAPLASSADWNDAVSLGHRLIGDPTDPITVVEFSDLECPACRAFHRSLNEMALDSAGDVQVILVHFPLPMHRFAVPAARAVECASEEGLTARFVETVFAHQDSVGLLGWGTYAFRSGLRDTARINACAANPDRVSRIERSVELGRRLGVTGTPTLFVNRVRLPSPGRAELERAIGAARGSPVAAR